MFNFPIIPVQASTFAEVIDPLFWALTIFLFFFTIGVTAAFIYLGIKYRQMPASQRRSVHVHSLFVELLWTVVPTVLALGIFFWGAITYFDYVNIPKNTIDISVMGKRWMWKVQHANGLREVNELHIPLGKPVKLTMTSQDVIHSFYIPAFRVKQDVLPARYSTMWFEATRLGEYPIFCAEYCGTEHSTMGGKVTVLTPAEYEEWLSGGPELTPMAAGEALFQQMGCATCHAAGDASRGPNLAGVFGTDRPIREAGTVLADEEYLRRSILEPMTQVVEGYTPLMPSFKNQLSDEDVVNLVAYIKSLKSEEDNQVVNQ